MARAVRSAAGCSHLPLLNGARSAARPPPSPCPDAVTAVTAVMAVTAVSSLTAGSVDCRLYRLRRRRQSAAGQREGK